MIHFSPENERDLAIWVKVKNFWGFLGVRKIVRESGKYLTMLLLRQKEYKVGRLYQHSNVLVSVLLAMYA